MTPEELEQWRLQGVKDARNDFLIGLGKDFCIFAFIIIAEYGILDICGYISIAFGGSSK
jgi:hypothetical protein